MEGRVEQGRSEIEELDPERIVMMLYSCLS